jgi:uncharacterized membrane protein
MSDDPTPDEGSADGDVPERGPLRARIRTRMLEDDHDHRAGSMFPVFLLTLLGVVISPLVGDWTFGRTISVIVIGGSTVLALERSGAHATIRHASIAIVVTGAVLVAVSPAVDAANSDWVESAALLIFALLLIVTPVVVIGRLLMRPRITLDTVSASLAGYLQIGLFFSVLYNLVAHLESVPFFAEQSAQSTFDFVYFSFITLCTVGYGDLTPATDAGRSLAILEAVIGQVFLVTIVAVVVGNIGRDLPHRSAGDRGAASS